MRIAKPCARRSSRSRVVRGRTIATRYCGQMRASGRSPNTSPNAVARLPATYRIVRPAGHTCGRFLMKIISYPNCKAAWGKVERTDTLGHGNAITITTYRSDDPEGPATQRAHEPHVQSPFTSMIVRRDPADRTCVTASIAIADRTVTSSTPFCTQRVAAGRLRPRRPLPVGGEVPHNHYRPGGARRSFDRKR